jgi:hypothetical protein
MLKVPSAALDVVVMVNRHDVWASNYADKILDACLPELDEVIRDSGHARAHGTFRSPRTGRIIQLYAKDGQQIASIDGYEFPVQMGSDAVLRPSGYLRYIKLEILLIGEIEQPTSIRISDFGNPDDLVLVKPPQKSNMQPLAGHYRSDTTNTEATVSVTSRGPQVVTTGRFGSMVYDDIKCLSDNIWLARPTGGAAEWFSCIWSFEGAEAQFRSCAIGTRSLAFRRVA